MSNTTSSSQSTSIHVADSPASSQESFEKSYPSTSLFFGYEGIDYTFVVASCDFATLNNHRERFLATLSQNETSNKSKPQSAVVLIFRFIQFLIDSQASKPAIRRLLQTFEREFLIRSDIHTLISELPDTLQAQKQALRTYYSAASACRLCPQSRESALFTAAEQGRVKPYVVFGGQGAINLVCVLELSELYFIYRPLLEDLLDATSPLISKLSRLPRTKDFYHGRYLDIGLWLQDPNIVPDRNTLAGAAFSFTIIGLLGLAHYCLTCKILNKKPGELRAVLCGASGHSQGIVVAAAIANSGSWESFYESAKLAVEILFWIGYECQQAAPRSSLSAVAVKDSLEHGEGRPSSLLSVRGLSKPYIEPIIATYNKNLPTREHVYLALANAWDNFVVAGPAKTLRGLSIHLRSIKASNNEDQARIPYSQRKPTIDQQFLPINTPFHTPHLTEAATIIKQHLSTRSLTVNDLAIPLYHSKTGLDLRKGNNVNVIDVLIDAITVDFLDWPATLSATDATHVIAFGGGKLGDLVLKNKDGEGVQVIMGSELRSSNQALGVKAKLFAYHLPDSSIRISSWGEEFRPRLVQSDDGKVMLDTKLSRLLGVPPVMVAGMTPTTAHWDFVAAIMNAGYHAELAGGGYLNTEAMSTAIRKIVANTPPGRGITCNLIYVSPQAIAWQIPMLRQLTRDGVPIDGLTVGAGVPSPEVATEYITTLGLRHISFKPGSISAIKDVIAIARTHSSFPIILQWTGGRGGGHHSFEDFHAPILSIYGEIRKCKNIILVGGSGFGDANGTYPYLTGDWARQFGRCSMPFDGILLRSRMMVAKEAHTSSQAKKLISESVGTTDWEKSYDIAVGGVITVQSEMGQPIHKIATRGVLLWAELDKKIFNLTREKRVAELKKNQEWIIRSLNVDYAKPWFGRNFQDGVVSLGEMTYGEVLARLICLMYVKHQHRWIDESYLILVFDFACRTAERLSPNANLRVSMLFDPYEFLGTFLEICSPASSQRLHPEDVLYFISRCKARGQKPVNFIPTLDENFEYWFKKDSLWQSEDVDAIVDQDAGRVCILHGPVSAQYTHDSNESAKVILDSIHLAHVAMVCRDYYAGNRIPMANEKTDNMQQSSLEFELSTTNGAATPDFPPSPATQSPAIVLKHVLDFGPARLSERISAVLNEDFILQGQHRVPNPFRRLLKLQHGTSLQVDYENSEILLTSEAGEQSHTLAKVAFYGRSDILVDLYQPGHHSLESTILPFKFLVESSKGRDSLHEVMEQRNDRIKRFYCRVWLGQDPDPSKNFNSIFYGKPITLTRTMLNDFMSVIGVAFPGTELANSVCEVFPIDISISVAWDVLVRPLLIKAIDGDLLCLVHRSNTFEYVFGAAPLHVGDTLSTESRIEAITIENSGKSVVVKATIKRDGQAVVAVTSTFFFRGSFSSFESTFQHIEEPEMRIHVVSSFEEAILQDREWFHLDDPSISLIGRSIFFKLETYVTPKSKRAFSSLETKGLIYEKSSDSIRHEIGKVYFAALDCQGNPVIDFLSRKGSSTTVKSDLKAPGWSGQSCLDAKIPNSNVNYGRVSKDHNPIHISAIFAGWANLPGTITHGMFTSGVARAALGYLIGDEDRSRLRRFSASFIGIVLPKDELSVKIQHKAMVQGRMIFTIAVTKKSTDEKVLEGEAEVEQGQTAYVFAGQGSQEQGMGMALYDSSPVAKRVWDDVDRNLY